MSNLIEEASGEDISSQIEDIQSLEEEYFEFIKGGFVTRVNIRFDKLGIPVSTSFEYNTLEEELEKVKLEKKRLVKSQIFVEAAELRDREKKLETKINSNQQQGSN